MANVPYLGLIEVELYFFDLAETFPLLAQQGRAYLPKTTHKYNIRAPHPQGMSSLMVSVLCLCEYMADTIPSVKIAKP